MSCYFIIYIFIIFLSLYTTQTLIIPFIYLEIDVDG